MRIAACGALLSLLAACALPAREASALRVDVVVPESRPGVTIGYLDAPAFDSRALLPAPPAPGSAGQAHDDAIAVRSLALYDTARWQQSAVDADLTFPAAEPLFACALGVEISAARTPHLVRLLRRSLADASNAGRAAKDHWQRDRPFVRNAAPMCTPQDAGKLATSASYPSGHAAIGWTWTLALVELAPARADTLLQRGRAFGESRLVCNLHWHSDIVGGERVGAATYARLQAAPEFRADLDAARREIAAQRAVGATPTHCDTETIGLRQSPIPTADARD
ncbi:phosphatase PAP2 family protein [Luteimonas sp. 3794]|uniref:acid phosphatase n=1 Tax=Luteimonas sp. 3794 TaxID=2817730 RepID=UPI00285DBE7B|nr:phosphatase PAP2 family protein [Luteimonas sp. 3794]MDR6990358.1 acid phosphatase (class A) [Luteimonas sp. 3794]